MRISSAFLALLAIAAVALFIYFAADDLLGPGTGGTGPEAPSSAEGIRDERIPDDWYRCVNQDEWFSPSEIDAMIAAAEGGDTLAEYSAGIAYMTGLGVKCAPSEGAKWILRAANGSMPQAEYAAGLIYLWGYGVPPDPEAALDWFSRAADELHAGALNAVAVKELGDARTRFERDDAAIEDCLTGDCLVWIRSTLEQSAKFQNERAMINSGFVNAFIGQRLDRRGFPDEAYEYYEEAYFWFALAALYVDDDEVRLVRDALAKSLPPATVDELDDRAASWLPERPLPQSNDPVDTDPGQFY